MTVAYLVKRVLPYSLIFPRTICSISQEIYKQYKQSKKYLKFEGDLEPFSVISSRGTTLPLGSKKTLYIRSSSKQRQITSTDQFFNWIAYPITSSRISRSKASSSNLSGRVMEKNGARKVSTCAVSFVLTTKSLILTSTLWQSSNKYSTFFEYTLTTPRSR